MTHVPVSIAAAAKINLYLRVIGRRTDGYHEIESVFLPLDCPEDRVTLRWGHDGMIRVHCSDAAVPLDERNLCWQAARAFLDSVGCERGVTVELRKAIPIAAGLGGGSSDAAAVLRGLNAMCGAPLGHAALVELGRRLGADVPFFLRPEPALGTGVGDQLQAVSLGCALGIVLVNPHFPAPVSWAYRRWNTVSRQPAPPLSGLLDAMARGDLGAIAAGSHNDLEYALLAKFPLLGMVGDALRAGGACAVHVSGSGPTLFALCEDGLQASLSQQVDACFDGALRVYAARAEGCIPGVRIG